MFIFQNTSFSVVDLLNLLTGGGWVGEGGGVWVVSSLCISLS